MEQLKKSSLLIYSDTEYAKAVNYQRMYSAPITLNYGPRHGRTKYIISAGTSDSIEIWEDGVFIYVLSQNSGLNYIGMDVINTESKEVEHNLFVSGNDIDNEESFFFGILDKDSKEQIKMICELI